MILLFVIPGLLAILVIMIVFGLGCLIAIFSATASIVSWFMPEASKQKATKPIAPRTTGKTSQIQNARYRTEHISQILETQAVPQSLRNQYLLSPNLQGGSSKSHQSTFAQARLAQRFDVLLHKPVAGQGRCTR